MTEAVMYHIARLSFDSDRVRANLERKGDFSPEEVDILISEYSDWIETSPDPLTFLRQKFENSAEKTVLVKKSSRYHIGRRCVYFSDCEEGAVAEAAFYLYHFNAGQPGAIRKRYALLRVEAKPVIADARKKFDKEELICTNHPIPLEAEEYAATQGASCLSAPSARCAKSGNYALYDFSAITKAGIVRDVVLEYDDRHPRVRQLNGDEREFRSVIVTLSNQ